ncbi:MAG: HlyD family efflux transporter periplasmic adaptor subunit [Bacteroidota bacterium]
MPENGVQEPVTQTEEVNSIEIRSEEVQEILSHVPNWIIRWGITAILLTVLAILVASWFIKYPDTIPSRIVLTTETPPANIISRSSGNLKFNIQDRMAVTKGTHLGIIENPANTDDISYLRSQLEGFKPFLDHSSQPPKSEFFKTDVELGTLQSSYIAFLNSLDNYDRFYELDYYDQQAGNLQKRINYYSDLNRQLNAQLSILDKELEIAFDNYRRDSILLTSGSAVPIEVNQSKSNYLQTKRQVQSAGSNITNNQIQIATLQGQIEDLKLDKNDNESRLRNEIESSFKQLESQYKQWEQNYLLISPIDGQVTFSKYWSDNQFVNTGEEVMTVIPDSQEIFGQLLMPEAGSGKVETGQKVIITFDNYPVDEYGIVIGQVETISLVPRDNNYTVRISLPNRLISSYDKDLKFKPQMQGTADIVTKDLRLIERVFNQLRGLFENAP